MRASVAVLIALAAAAPALGQDTGALYIEQVRRNQVYGTVGQPPPVAIPPRPGVGAYYHDEIRLRQEGRLGPVLPTRPARGALVIDDSQRVVQLQETNIPGRRTSSGIRATVRRAAPARRVVVPRATSARTIVVRRAPIQRVTIVRRGLTPLNRFD